MSEVRDDRRYTKDHEWAKATDRDIEVGITEYAVTQLGDITLINLDVKEGDRVEEGKTFGTIESVKTLSDLFSPIAGTVKRINKDLENKPELVNSDCYAAWMVVIEAESANAIDGLMDAKSYGALVDSLDH